MQTERRAARLVVDEARQQVQRVRLRDVHLVGASVSEVTARRDAPRRARRPRGGPRSRRRTSRVRCARSRQQRDERRRVDAAARSNAPEQVAHEPVVQPSRRAGAAPSARRFARARCRASPLLELPASSARSRTPLSLARSRLPRPELPDAVVERVRSRGHEVARYSGSRRATAARRRMLEQRLDLATEHECAASASSRSGSPRQAVAREESRSRSGSQIANANNAVEKSTHAGTAYSTEATPTRCRSGCGRRRPLLELAPGLGSCRSRR
jgi:hypothetical protein